MKRDRNHEGYHDPTAGKAIRKVEKKKRKSGTGLAVAMGDLPVFWQAVGNMNK